MAPIKDTLSTYLVSKNFYELAQEYRNAPITDQVAVNTAFNNLRLSVLNVAEIELGEEKRLRKEEWDRAIELFGALEEFQRRLLIIGNAVRGTMRVMDRRPRMSE